VVSSIVALILGGCVLVVSRENDVGSESGGVCGNVSAAALALGRSDCESRVVGSAMGWSRGWIVAVFGRAFAVIVTLALSGGLGIALLKVPALCEGVGEGEKRARVLLAHSDVCCCLRPPSQRLASACCALLLRVGILWQKGPLLFS